MMSTCGVVQENGADYEQDEELFGRATREQINGEANQ